MKGECQLIFVGNTYNFFLYFSKYFHIIPDRFNIWSTNKFHRICSDSFNPAFVIEASKLSSENLKIIKEIAERTIFIKEHVDSMIEARKVANKIESEREKAIAYHDEIAPMLEEIRYHIDKLELIVDNQLWTLPKYRELLFIR